MLLQSDKSHLLVVDVQERLMPAVLDGDRVISRTEILIAAARRLGIPVTASQQYPRGLGPLVPQVLSHLETEEVLDKTAFNCMADMGLVGRVTEFSRPQVVVCGVETHICVLQTAMGLAAKGYSPFVVIDACSSRSDFDKTTAADRMRADGICVVTTEMVCFEWLGEAGTDAFRDISKLIK